MKYEKPEMEFIIIYARDVIRTSLDPDENPGGAPSDGDDNVGVDQFG